MKPIAFAKPLLGEEEARAAAEAVLSGWVTQGPRVQQFEADFAGQTQARFACAVSNCTTGLQLALLEAGVQPGEVVLTVSHSFIATANAVRAVGAEPVFVDIDPETLNMAPQALEQALERDFRPAEDGLRYGDVQRFCVSGSLFGRLRKPTGRLGAILVPHQLGMPADMARLLPLAEKAGAPLIEDAACAIGSKLSPDGGATWAPVGRPHGRTACFSLHPRKVLTCGEGGMLTTSSEDSDARFRLLRHHGMSLSDSARHAANDVIFEDYLVAGYNFRMTDIQAAIGSVQLTRLGGMVAWRRSLAAAYAEALEGEDGVSLQREPQWARSNWQSFAVTLQDPALQKPVMRRLLDLGVGTRRGVMCAHLEPPYAALWPADSLPASVHARDAGVLLPMHQELTLDDVARVAEALRKALRA